MYITTSISYANGHPHVGHALEAVLADAIARFYRSRGEVFFQTGTDEHGIKVAQSAERRGLSPQEHVDEISDLFRSLCSQLEISQDRFIRTTETANKDAARLLWEQMGGDIHLGKYEGWYSIREEAFFSDDEVVKNDEGVFSPDGTPVEWHSEPSYFFNLEKYRLAIVEHIQNNPDFIVPVAAKNEVLGMLRNPLPELSISRTNFSWGVAVPNDPEHVMYVWVDALSNYAVERWPADIHVIGKDIVKFHAIYWPAFLLSAGRELPKQLLVHGFLTHNGIKMSKSLGNVVDPRDEIARVGVDALRLYLLSLARLGVDTDYSDDGVVVVYNSYLANNIGNLAHRVVTQLHKHFGSRIPSGSGRLIQIDNAWREYHRYFEEGNIPLVLSTINGLASFLNSYVSEQQPWNVVKHDPSAAGEILRLSCDGIRALGEMLLPIVPSGAERLIETISGDILPVRGPAFPRI